MRPTCSTNPLRKKFEQDIKDFKSRGGKIEKVPMGAGRGWVNPHKRRGEK